MENASKALIMAAGVLIGILIIAPLNIDDIFGIVVEKLLNMSHTPGLLPKYI